MGWLLLLVLGCTVLLSGCGEQAQEKEDAVSKDTVPVLPPTPDIIEVPGGNSSSSSDAEIVIDKMPINKEEAMNNYLETVRESIVCVDFQIWLNVKKTVNGAYTFDTNVGKTLYDTNKLWPNSNQEKIRRKSVNDLRNYDFDNGEDRRHIITKSQLELLGKLYRYHEAVLKLSQNYCPDSQFGSMNHEQVLKTRNMWWKNIDSCDTVSDGWKIEGERKGQKYMNEVLREYQIYNENSLHQFFTQCSIESGAGKHTLEQNNTNIATRGAGYIQFTSYGNYEEFYKYLVKMEYGEAEIKSVTDIRNQYAVKDSKGNKISISENGIDKLNEKYSKIYAELVDFSDHNNNKLIDDKALLNIKKGGPYLVSQYYPWEVSAFYWNKLPRSGMDGGKTLENIALTNPSQLTKMDLLLEICLKCFAPSVGKEKGNDRIKNVNDLGHNVWQKVMIYAFLVGAFDSSASASGK